MQMMFEHIQTVGDIVDVAGVAVIALGGVVALGVALGRLLHRSGDAYFLFREEFGRAILLGLELLVAADIIRTVAITPTRESVIVLGGIVLIRTFLSFSLEVEMTGRWPWQQHASHFPASAGGRGEKAGTQQRHPDDGPQRRHVPDRSAPPTNR